MSGMGEHSSAGDDEHRLVIYQSADRSGSTFSLSPESRRALEKRFGDSIRPAPRIFIAHTTRADFERLHSLSREIVLLLTGLEAERLRGLKVEFRDPVTEQLL
jgi:hypothetical protein